MDLDEMVMIGHSDLAIHCAKVQNECAALEAKNSILLGVLEANRLDRERLAAELAALKSQEPVGIVDSHYVEFNGDYTYANWMDEDNPPPRGTKLYTSPTPTDRDAERYRYLRRRDSMSMALVSKYREEKLDVAIDAAMKEGK